MNLSRTGSFQSRLEHKMESNSLDFKLQLDVREEIHFLNLVTHVAAMANSEGGHIIIGAYAKDQLFSVPGITDAAYLGDPTLLGQKVNSFCSSPISLQMREVSINYKDSPTRLLAIYVPAAATPAVFTKTGETTAVPCRRVFHKGDIYIRHNAATQTNPHHLCGT